MLEHPWEYGFTNLFITPKKGTITDLNNSKIQGEITTQLGKLAGKLPSICEKSPDGQDGWTINSHSLATVGGVIMITILLQRSRG